MELIEEIISSRRVGYRRVDPNRGSWEDMGIDTALEQPSLIYRFKKTIKFIQKTVGIESLKESKILDTGEYNPLSEWLKRSYGIAVTNTPPDMDFDNLQQDTEVLGEFDYIFAFEILEHLMNPLAFVEFLHKNLKKNGTVFLSTPFARPRFLWSRYHFTEYFPDKVEFMANKAGFEVVRYERRNVYPGSGAIYGIRPFFRAFWFERIMLFEFRKQ